jgi:hypothetical protein
MEYKGYHYAPEMEEEEDVRKRYHTVVRLSDNKHFSMPYSPYSYPSREYFEMWIEAGLPGYPERSKVELVAMITERHLLGDKDGDS